MPSLIGQLAAAAGEERPLELGLSLHGGWTLRRHWEHGGALRIIRGSGWDYVVLQEQNLTPIVSPAQMHESVRAFDAEIKRVDAQTMLYLTWARQDDPEQQKAISDAYISIAEEVGAVVAPVGIAWQRVLAERPELTLFMKDGRHPSALGSYLAACVFYASLHGRSPVGSEARTVDPRRSPKRSKLPYEPEELSLEVATFLQRVAW
jgi:hypothetical protein